MRERRVVASWAYGMAGSAALLVTGCGSNPLSDAARVLPSVWHSKPSDAPGTDGKPCLHWIGTFESGGGYWSHCPIVEGEPTGVPIAVPLTSDDSHLVTPVDLAVSVAGDVLISHVQPHGVRVIVEGDPRKTIFDVVLPSDDVPFGVAADPRGRKGYVVTSSAKDERTCRIWSFATDGGCDLACVATWKCRCDSATGLEVESNWAGLCFYVGLSNAEGGDLVVRVTPKVGGDPEVQTVVKAVGGSTFPVYAVACDPVRSLIHFAVSGRRAIFTAEIPKAGAEPTEIDLRRDEREIATIPTSALVSQISFTPSRDRLIWAQGEAESPSVFAGTLRPGGIYQSRILAPMTSTGADEVLGRLPPRAAVFWYPSKPLSSSSPR